MNEAITLFSILSATLALFGWFIWKLDRTAYLAFKEDGSGEVPHTLFKFTD